MYCMRVRLAAGCWRLAGCRSELKPVVIGYHVIVNNNANKCRTPVEGCSRRWGRRSQASSDSLLHLQRHGGRTTASRAQPPRRGLPTPAIEGDDDLTVLAGLEKQSSKPHTRAHRKKTLSARESVPNRWGRTRGAGNRALLKIIGSILYCRIIISINFN